MQHHRGSGATPQSALPDSLAPRNINVTNLNRGLFAALMGEAHQYLVAGVLLRLGFYVALFPVRGLPYDLIIVAYRDKKAAPDDFVLIRAQVRTLSRRGTLSLTGGRRAGRGMITLEPYRRGYRYTTHHNDLIIAVDRCTLDLYFIPTRLTTEWPDSVSVKRFKPLRNRYHVLLQWNDKYLSNILRT